MVLERFIEANFRKRLWLLFRGLTGLVLAFWLTCATVLLCLLELGNMAWDVMQDDS